jgi:ferric-dicitrate binding protein FerR (iron transport regulator)
MGQVVREDLQLRVGATNVTVEVNTAQNPDFDRCAAGVQRAAEPLFRSIRQKAQSQITTAGQWRKGELTTRVSLGK